MPKRQYGTGSITWLSTTRARLRVRVEGERRTKVATFSHRDHGGRGQAAEALAAYLAEMEGELARPGGRQWLTQAIEAYVVHLERIGRSPSTVEGYRNVVKKVGGLGMVPIGELTTPDFDRLYGDLSDGGLKDSTIRTVHAHLHAVLNQAIKWGWLTENPADNATAPVYRPPDRVRLAPAQVWQLIIAAERPRSEGGAEDRVLAVAMFLATCAGARRGELAGLRWEDFDPNGRTLTLERQWVPHTGGQRLADLKSETGALDGRRTVTLAPLTIVVLERFRALQRADHQREPGGWLLSHDAGTTPLSAKALGMDVSSLCRRAGLKKVTLHSFRRTSATQLHAAGVDMDTASRRMGHTKAVMMRDYVLGTDDRAIAAAEALEARLIEQGLPIGEILTMEAPTQTG